MITRNFKLFLNAGKQIPLMINVSQYDHGEKWVFTLYDDNGQKYTPSTGAIVGIKADNKGIINTGTVNSAGQVEIMETQQMTAAAGKAVFELVIDDGTHGTANFVVLVEPKPGNNADLSETDISMIEEAIEAASSIKPYGSPLVASTVAGMTDETKVYVYTGSETGYTSGHWYYYDGSDWADGGVYNSVAVQTDTTLAISGMAADAKKTGDEIADLKSQISGGGLTADIKQALMNCFNYVAWKDNNPNASQYVSALQNALYPPANLTSISAVFTQGANVIYDTDSLDTLKQYLVVTAHYSDSTTEVVNDYVLTGTLTEGTSTITVTYGGKTTTFTVTVTEAPLTALYSWDLTSSLTDSVDGVVATTNGTFTSETGVVLNGSNQYIDFGAVYDVDRTYELDIASFGNNTTSVSSKYRRVFMVGTSNNTSSGGAGLICATGSSKQNWWVYLGSAWDSAKINEGTYEALNGKTLKVYVDSSSKLHIYTKTIGADDSTYESFGAVTSAIKSFTNGHIYVGSSSGDYVQPITVTGLRIYEGEV